MQTYHQSFMFMQAISEGDSSDSDADEFDLAEQRCNRDGTVASGTAAELRLERELAKDPWGRFGGRNGKLARIRAQENALLAAQQGENCALLRHHPRTMYLYSPFSFHYVCTSREWLPTSCKDKVSLGTT